MFDDKLGLTGYEAQRFPVRVSITGTGIMQLLSELNGGGGSMHSPLAWIDDFIQMVRTVCPVVGFAKNSDADLDECASRFRFVITEPLVSCGEFLDRAHNSAARTGDDIIASIDEIAHVRVGFRVPGAVNPMSFELEILNHARPVEASAAIVTMLRIGQIDGHLNRTVCQPRLRNIGSSLRHEHGSRQQSEENKFRVGHESA